MPLLRQSLYAQNVNLYLAPTADGRDTWLSLMRTVGLEGRAFVLSANQCTRRKHLSSWILKPPEQGEHEVDAGQEEYAVVAVTASGTDGTEDGHASGGGKRRPVGRRKSTVTVTEDNHQICWPWLDAKEAMKDGSNGKEPNGVDPVAPSEGHDDKPIEVLDTESKSTPAKSRRRKSILIDTPDRHQICLPVVEDAESGQVTTKANKMDEPRPSSSAADDLASGEEIVCRGGSCIVSPSGEVLAGPLWDVDDGDELLVVEADFEDCERGRLDLDVAGSYSRNDAFRLIVRDLDLSPPP